MSKEGNKYFSMQMDFVSVWERIKKSTDIKNITQLAAVIGKTQPTVSAKQGQKKEFPIEWAYLVSEKYGLSLNWVLKGEEPVRAGAAREPKNSYVLLIDEWVSEMRGEDPRREEWFKCNFEDAFPSFKSWMQRKNAANQHRRIPETVA
ncbi:MAG: helix-turn-helix domain-containing protein [Candidatus Electronema sp. V4]|uniref:helix-turn-helix domain-containing protein n=1 Tax=Candidatus Electronema sp. V4 TaxID=3454756 RepID=UPI0040558FF4